MNIMLDFTHRLSAGHTLDVDDYKRSVFGIDRQFIAFFTGSTINTGLERIQHQVFEDKINKLQEALPMIQLLEEYLKN